ncbi:MAG: hypothetical protein JWP63_3926 [Candidatus Solibacter sp.]|nr:hypothetical protein [Candidatus Solibacter sp.]
MSPLDFGRLLNPWYTLTSSTTKLDKTPNRLPGTASAIAPVSATGYVRSSPPSHHQNGFRMALKRTQCSVRCGTALSTAEQTESARAAATVERMNSTTSGLGFSVGALLKPSVRTPPSGAHQPPKPCSSSLRRPVSASDTGQRIRRPSFRPSSYRTGRGPQSPIDPGPGLDTGHIPHV